jgi:hypothetical protein
MYQCLLSCTSVCYHACLRVLETARAQLPGWCLVSLLLLSPAASAAAWADGATYPLHLALIPLWVIDAAGVISVFCAYGAVLRDSLRGEGRFGRRRGCLLATASLAVAIGAVGLLKLTPALLAAKVDGAYDVSWVAVCIPALIAAAVLSCAGCTWGGEIARFVRAAPLGGCWGGVLQATCTTGCMCGRVCNVLFVLREMWRLLFLQSGRGWVSCGSECFWYIEMGRDGYTRARLLLSFRLTYLPSILCVRTPACRSARS